MHVSGRICILKITCVLIETRNNEVLAPVVSSKVRQVLSRWFRRHFHSDLPGHPRGSLKVIIGVCGKMFIGHPHISWSNPSNPMVFPVNFVLQWAEDCLGTTSVAECLFRGGHDVIRGRGVNAIMDGPELSWYFFCKQMDHESLTCALPQGTLGDAGRVGSFGVILGEFLKGRKPRLEWVDLASRSLAWKTQLSDLSCSAIQKATVQRTFLGGLMFAFVAD